MQPLHEDVHMALTHLPRGSEFPNSKIGIEIVLIVIVDHVSVK